MQLRNTAEPAIAKYIPGGYSPSRCMRLRGRSMTYAIFAFAGCAITFFGYDTAVMSQVNNNPDYQHRMGVASGSDRDAAAIGGLVSLWFGGFAVGMNIYPIYRTVTKSLQIGWTRCFPRRLHGRCHRSVEDDSDRLSLGHPRSGTVGVCAEHHLACVCSCYQRNRMRISEYHCARVDVGAC
jgi:hypothetical protein